MALTKSQEIALYTILEVPYDSKVRKLMGEDNLLALDVDASNSDAQAMLKITEFLTAMDSEVETVLAAYLDDWLATGTDETVIETGGVGSVSGVSYSPAAKRDQIRRRVLIIVPFYRKHEELQNSGKAVTSIPLYN